MEGPALVGRAGDRRALSEFPQLLAGGAAALVLEGPPGIGKSSLWRLALEAMADRALVLSTRPGGLDTELGYSGLSDLLDPLSEERERLPEPARTHLRGALRIGPVPPAQVGRGDVARAVASLLAAAAERGPVVLAIDDLPWLDGSTSAVLGHAIRRSHRAPVGLVVTRRTPGPAGELIEAVPQERVTVQVVAPLTESETDSLVRRRLGAALLRPVVRQLHQASAGNPMFALELARSVLLDPSPLPPGPLPLPGTLAELVGRRLSALTPSTRDALLVVAMTSRPTVDLVEQVLSTHAAAEIRRGIDAGLLDVERGVLRLTHPLLAAACYAAATPARRRTLHRRLADLLDDPEERAQHLLGAVVLPDDPAAGAIELGAVAAHARGAPDAAAVLAAGALRLTPDTATTSVVRRSLMTADCLWEAGRCARSEEVLRPLADRLPAGPARARVLHRLALAAAALHSWPASQALLERGIGETGDDRSLRAVFERDLAFGLMQAGRLPSAAPHVVATEELARVTGEPEAREDAWVMRSMYDVVRGRPVAASFAASFAEEAAHRLSGRRHQPTTAPDRGFATRAVLVAAVLKWTDQLEAARRVLERLHDSLWSRDEDGLLLPVFFQLGELECWAGRARRSEEVTGLARETGLRSGLAASAPMWVYLEALTAARAGDLDRARVSAVRALEVSTATGEARHQMRAHAVSGFIDLSAGDAAAAAAHYEEEWALERACGYGHPGVIRSGADHVEACVEAGDLRRAEQRLEDLAQAAGRSRSRWGAAVSLRCRGLLEAARGDLEAAVPTLRDAVARHADAPDPLDTGRSLLLLGGVLRRTNQRAEARRVLGLASERFAACGAAGWRGRADHELARAGGRTASRSGLTRSESELAALVAHGRPNKEIAGELHVSVKTVEAHLTAIYRKLGLRSRTELTSYLLTRSSPGEP